MNEYKCPMCQNELSVEVGTVINRLDGITMGCGQPMNVCPNTAIGHGKNEKEAYAIVVQKYAKSKNKD